MLLLDDIPSWNIMDAQLADNTPVYFVGYHSVYNSRRHSNLVCESIGNEELG